MNLIPAYGRDYKSKAAIIADLLAGKDFLCQEFGKRDIPINFEQIKQTDTYVLTVRYGQLRKVTTIKLSEVKAPKPKAKTNLADAQKAFNDACSKAGVNPPKLTQNVVINTIDKDGNETPLRDLMNAAKGIGVLDVVAVGDPKPAPASWAPEVQVDGFWHRNALRFATEQEAKDNACNLYGRWTLTTGYRATEATEPPNYRWIDGALVEIKP